jgi:hypothetical protein
MGSSPIPATIYDMKSAGIHIQETDLSFQTVRVNPAPKLNPGDIIIMNNWDGNFLSKAIRFFTKSWSHTALGFFDMGFHAKTAQTVFEANLTVGITDWERAYGYDALDLRVYQWAKPVDPQIVWELFDKYNGNVYGWWQLIYFIWRWIVEGLHLPKRWAHKNFFPNREICTELIYVLMERKNEVGVAAVLAMLDRDQNTVHPGDIIWACEELVKLGVLNRTYNRER